MASVQIRNVSLEMVALPYPFAGVLAPGKVILVAATKAGVTAALGGNKDVLGTLDIRDVNDPTAYSTDDAAYLGHYTTGLQPSDVGVAVPVSAGAVPAPLRRALPTSAWTSKVKCVS